MADELLGLAGDLCLDGLLLGRGAVHVESAFLFAQLCESSGSVIFDFRQ